jgi:hypothetical protein
VGTPWSWALGASREPHFSAAPPRNARSRHVAATFRFAPPSLRDLYTGYLMASYTLNIGMYIAMTTKPTMAPTSTIMIGSRIEVSALTAAATSSS